MGSVKAPGIVPGDATECHVWFKPWLKLRARKTGLAVDRMRLEQYVLCFLK
jgi:hypothetical protein